MYRDGVCSDVRVALMGSGFLGFGSLSRENQIRLGLFGSLLLALECVLAGLVTDAPVRGYVMHALTAGLAVWALQDPSTASIRAAGSAGVAAVANEALMLADAQMSLRYLLPGLLLLGVSIWVMERSLSDRGSPRQGSRLAGSQLSSEQLPPPTAGRSMSDQKLAVGAALSGAAIGLYGLLGADWVLIRTLFGFVRRTLTFQELRLAWRDLGTPDAVGEAVLGGGQLLAYASFAAVGLALASRFSRGFVLHSPWRMALVVIVAAGAICNLLIVASLLAASSSVVVLGGAWLLPIGLAVSAFGVWSSTAR